MKQLLTTGVLVGLLLPFILQTTLYPFFRFGMFAEPVRYDIQQEQFALHYQVREQTTLPVPEAALKVKKSTLDYLLRNYYYRQESELFLKRASLLLPDTFGTYPLVILRIMEKDTTLIKSRTVK